MPEPGQYRLIARVAGDEKIATFRARRADGAPVLVHQLAPGHNQSEILRMAMLYMMRNPADKGGRILDLFETDGFTNLVTVDETACLSLKEWLQWESSKTPQATSVRVAPEAAPQASDPTKKMALPSGEAPPTVLMQPPGEFTRVIQNPARADSPAPAPAASQPLISSPALPIPRGAASFPMASQPSTGSKIIPFLASFLIVLAVFLIAVVLIRQM